MTMLVRDPGGGGYCVYRTDHEGVFCWNEDDALAAVANYYSEVAFHWGL